MQQQVTDLQDQVTELSAEVGTLSASLAALRDQVARLERRADRTARAARSSESQGSITPNGAGETPESEPPVSGSPGYRSAPPTPASESNQCLRGCSGRLLLIKLVSFCCEPCQGITEHLLAEI